MNRLDLEYWNDEIDKLILDIELMGINDKLKITFDELKLFSLNELVEKIIEENLSEVLLWEFLLKFLKDNIKSEISKKILDILENWPEEEYNFNDVKIILNGIIFSDMDFESKKLINFSWEYKTWWKFCLEFGLMFFWKKDIDEDGKYITIFSILLKKIKFWEIDSINELEKQFFILEKQYGLNILKAEEICKFILNFIDNKIDGFIKFKEFLGTYKDKDFTSSTYQNYIIWENWKKADWVSFVSHFWRIILWQSEINIINSQINKALLQVKKWEINNFWELKDIILDLSYEKKFGLNFELKKLKKNNLFNKFQELIILIPDELFLNSNDEKMPFFWNEFYTKTFINNIWTALLWVKFQINIRSRWTKIKAILRQVRNKEINSFDEMQDIFDWYT